MSLPDEDRAFCQEYTTQRELDARTFRKPKGQLTIQLELNVRSNASAIFVGTYENLIFHYSLTDLLALYHLSVSTLQER